MLRREIESLEQQLRDKDLNIIGREKQLTLHKDQLESDKRKFISEKDITAAQLEGERQTIRVSRQISVVCSKILKHLRILVNKSHLLEADCKQS